MLMCTFLYAFVFAETFYKILAETLICDPGEKYTCTGYNFGLAVVFSDDKTLCNGNCYKPNNCTNTWSEWSYTSKGVHSFVEARSRSCGSDKRMEVEIRCENVDPLNLTTTPIIPHRSRRLLSSFIPIPKELDKFISKTFRQKTDVRLYKAVGSRMDITCDNDITAEITAKYKKSSARWLHNNVGLVIEAERMVYQFNSLQIQNIKPEDQGVYVCQMEYEKKQYKTVALFTLVTQPGIQVHVKETQTLILNCPSFSIYHTVKDAKRLWLLNRKLVLPPISILNTSSERFYAVNKYYAGNWTCEVPDKSNNISWTIITYEVIIDPPPTQFEVWLMYFKDNPHVTGAIGLGVLGCFLVFVVIIQHQVEKQKQKREKKEKEIKDKLEEFKKGGIKLFADPNIENMTKNDMSNDQSEEEQSQDHNQNQVLYPEYPVYTDKTHNKVYYPKYPVYTNENLNNYHVYTDETKDYSNYYPGDRTHPYYNTKGYSQLYAGYDTVNQYHQTV